MTAMLVMSSFGQKIVPSVPARLIPLTAFLAYRGSSPSGCTARRISRAGSAGSLRDRRNTDRHVDIEIGRYGKTAPKCRVDGPASDRLAQRLIPRPVHGWSLSVNHLA